MELGGVWWTNVLNSAVPPQRQRPDTRLEHQDPVSHTAQKKGRKKERKKENIIIMLFLKNVKKEKI